MMSGKTRSLYGMAFKHFINSLKPRKSVGVFMGNDNQGNQYFEVPADPSRGKRHPRRWIAPSAPDKYNQENMPAEWDAWLRNRRSDPPSESEIQDSHTIAMMKKQNADKIAEKEGKKLDTPIKHSSMSSFPVYDEYEVTPGKGTKT